ncbi:MAG: TetR/AcrR family transcriptional regulator [Chloroflexi bacterium]|nr:MAG: TetR/AcrR family transcriptional regulator [Chloroflexota bacterium]
MSGKLGRPAEDRVQRRREIWGAVGPLIEKFGARNLTMRQAAAVSFLSLGGLYHYFPNRRSLVLFGLDQEAHKRVCAEFNKQYGHLKDSDPQAATEAFIRFFGSQVSFVRPAVQAALELGAEEFMSRLEANLNVGLDGFAQTLRLALPDADDRDLRAVARSVRRLVLAGLVDRSITQSEIEEELRAVVSGVPVGRRHAPFLDAGSTAVERPVGIHNQELSRHLVPDTYGISRSRAPLRKS